MAPAQHTWESLFAPPDSPDQGLRVPMRLVRKGGKPLLLLPGKPRLAAATLDLYPAQTRRARVARTLLRSLLRASLPFGTESVTLLLWPNDPFVRFLASLSDQPTESLRQPDAWQPRETLRSPSPALKRTLSSSEGEREGVRGPSGSGGLSPPALGVLAGNPASDGQRFLLLVFDASRRPVAVVKAGLSQRAQALIKREERFLTEVPPNTAGIPGLRAKFASPRLRGLALGFFPGDSPRPRHETALPSLLTSWLDPKRTTALADLPDWTRLETAASASELLPGIAGPLRARSFHPAIYHGDFAPWNIKVSPTGAWTVLDWERGELAGIPGWDWFHYVIQSAILVGRLPRPALVQRVEQLLRSSVFQQYAARAAILGCERGLLLAYLLHVVAVLKPTEGLEPTRELLQTLASR